MLILKGRLYEACTDSNAFLYTKEPACYRAYYYLNDLSEEAELPDADTVVEILYRGNQGMPEDEVIFLKNNGFVENLVRDQYTAIYKNIIHTPYAEGIAASYAGSIKEVEDACLLFNDSFDKFSGDFIPSEEYGKLLENRNIIIAKDNDGKFLGAVHFSFAGKVSEFHHVAVRKDARGKGVGSTLLNAYINLSHENDFDRYSLWVQKRNTVAVKMYEQTGFRYCNKSTLSMIKYKM